MSDSSSLALYAADGVRAIDASAIETHGIPGLTLMRRAATACAETLIERWPEARRVLVLCGSGNNAGDGYIVAGMLADRGLDVTFVSIGDVSKLGPDARRGHDYCEASPASGRSLDEIRAGDFDVVVDALLGTGTKGQVRDDYVPAISAINGSGRPVLAVDIPSGLCADTGVRLGETVRADVTVTFVGKKRGLYTLDGPDHAGDIVFTDLGIPDDAKTAASPSARLVDLPALLSRLPARPRNAHKNMFGHVLVIGGDQGMGGAASMSAETALAAGAGMVSVATHPVHVSAILARRPELMVRGVEHPDDLRPLLARASVVVLGPGLGRSSWSSAVFRCAIEATRDETLPVVLDADGLNLLALHPEQRDNWILTPHPGEASNLLQDNRIQQDRFASVEALRTRFGGVALLKGAGTVIATERGTLLCAAGNPGMSVAGMGDVLAGLLAALVAQGLDLPTATSLGVAVHAAAGDRQAGSMGEIGIRATDLLPEIRAILNARVSE